MDVGSAPTSQKYRTVSEEHERPTNRDALIAKVRNLIDEGGVQRLIIESGAPLRVRRTVLADPEDSGVPDGLPEEDLLSAIRNAPMEEFLIESKMGFHEYLFRAFRVLSMKKLKPKAIVVNNKTDLLAWVKLEKHSELLEVYGVEVVQHKEIPHDVLVLVGAPPDLMDTVSFSLRLEISSTIKK